MKPIGWYFFIALVLSVLMMCNYFALESTYRDGYERGRRDTNSWWIDQKSRYMDTKDILEKTEKEGWHNV
jgi:hypothetical protein